MIILLDDSTDLQFPKPDYKKLFLKIKFVADWFHRKIGDCCSLLNFLSDGDSKMVGNWSEIAAIADHFYALNTLGIINIKF